MVKKIMGAALLLALAGTAWGQTAGTNTVQRNGYCFNQTTGQMVDCVTGTVLTYDANPSITKVVSSGIESVTLPPGGTALSQTECMDLSAYSKVTLLLSWTTAAAADSDSVQIALKVFNKESAAWGTNDTQLFINSVMRTASAADTTMTEPLLAVAGMSSAKIPRPTLYIYRSTATTANVDGTLKNTVYGLGSLNRMYAGNGGVAIDLTGMCGALNYVGLQVSNWNGGKSLLTFKAVYLCRR